ncbi:uncharacterized protein BO66DRAFT_406101 [Aspergillus aculeatinus CBS 121060]|uniref:Uncharacterized protein n=1 Tax=Aspergillus aculeatinus CBS 121060 TaxID=1448322 RepID=A0ACD1GTP8_9EURO|nr:hypothetical protein BO66DRAFT_406101 [Aspergillus aculeatinus CBS 121060]RAH64751.1 hypothetical protein BO66DRAFT_406101 [Aspergillus aculeatinus CBS 121060]
MADFITEAILVFLFVIGVHLNSHNLVPHIRSSSARHPTLTMYVAIPLFILMAKFTIVHPMYIYRLAYDHRQIQALVKRTALARDVAWTEAEIVDWLLNTGHVKGIRNHWVALAQRRTLIAMILIELAYIDLAIFMCDLAYRCLLVRWRSPRRNLGRRPAQRARGGQGRRRRPVPRR